MTMTEILNIMLTLIAGMALGIFFFGGLWFTVKKAINIKAPALWFLGSFFLRVGVVMLGFYYISFGGWLYLIFSLSGFILARLAVTSRTKSLDKKPSNREVYHEA